MIETVRESQVARTLTDQSLRTERERADLECAEGQRRINEAADEIVRVARAAADEILATARLRADERLTHDGLRAAAQAIVAAEREVADEVLRQERTSADERLVRVREEQMKFLQQLSPLERDKTDLYLLTERLRSDTAITHRDDFLSIVTHDLRNLLSGIVLSASSLLEETTSTRPTSERIQRYAARMDRLIGDLVDVGSIDAGRLAVDALRGDLSAAASEAVDTFRSLCAAKGVSLEVVHLDSPLLADFDHGRILQVLTNLFSNAVKFTERGGKITLSGERVGEAIQFCIRDTGPGIEATMLESIFERFWQVGKNDRRGLGLGLYISRCIIEAHGGRIWAESQVGHGSQFCFMLPAA
jgi:signal transduction histidine kinase